ncbi:hypothetical protein MRBLWO14_001155 [Microbacterium sp. LWO14-1.2]|uniref:hypothetical protein n=1 Tax=Microbacterium sp. LWO14-1.2 TaxID=3135263 RepID=UPI003139AC8C
MSLERRRELSRMTKAELIDLIDTTEEARTGYQWTTEDGQTVRRTLGPWLVIDCPGCGMEEGYSPHICQEPDHEIRRHDHG